MDRIKSLVRDPALLIDLAESLLVLLVAFGLPLGSDQETYIVAVLIAVAGLVKGLATKPFPVTVVTDLGRAVLVLAASFGLDLPPDRIAVAVTFLGTVTTLIARGQITPVYDPVTSSVGSGSGPVNGEAGHADVVLVLLIGVGMLASAPNLYLMASAAALCLLTVYVVDRRHRRLR